MIDLDASGPGANARVGKELRAALQVLSMRGGTDWHMGRGSTYIAS